MNTVAAFICATITAIAGVWIFTVFKTEFGSYIGALPGGVVMALIALATVVFTKRTFRFIRG